jgi:hypothetical protein
VEGTRASAYRGVRQFADEWLAMLNLMISNDAIYWTLVVPDIVIGGSAEPWLISRGENAIVSRALNYLFGPRLFRCFTDLGIDTFGPRLATAQRDDLRRREGES